MRKLIMMFLLLSSVAINAQQINTYLSQQEILVGQPDTLTFEVVTLSPEFVFPVFNDTLSSDLEILQVSKIDTSASGKGFVFVQQILFTSFDTGYFYVPQVAFQVDNKTLLSQSLQVKIVDISIDLSKNIHGIQDIEEAPLTFREVLVFAGKWVGLMTGIFLIIILSRKFYLKYKLKKENAVVLAPEIPFMDTFWERLTAVEDQKFWQKGEVKRFHSQVTSLMRSYLEYRYGIKAMEQTTNQILTQLMVLVSDQMLYAKIEQTLRFADMVKFAKATGVQDQHEKAIENLRELVEITNFDSAGGLRDQSSPASKSNQTNSI
jgi:hypothetical protein